MSTQMALFPSHASDLATALEAAVNAMIRVPDLAPPPDYYDYFHRTGECLYCPRELNHEMHAFYHYRKFHAPKPPRALAKCDFFVLQTPKVGNRIISVQVTYGQYLAARTAHMTTAVAKPQPKKRKTRTR